MRAPQSRPSQRRGAFTLLELIIVAGLLAVLIGLLAPTLRVARPAKYALQELKATLDRARSTAIRHRTDTFVAFTDSLPMIEGNPTTDAYRYNRYAIFRRDTRDLNPAARYFPDLLTCPLVQVQEWRQLPDGVLFAISEDIETESPEIDILTLIDTRDPEDHIGSKGTAIRPFPLTAAGTKTTLPLPFIAFDHEGKVRLPGWDENAYLHLGLVEGKLDDGRRTITSFRPAGSGSRPVPDTDLLIISQQTGRTREVGVSANP